MVRVELKPKFIDWACGRIGVTPGMLEGRFPHLEEWRNNQVNPTLKQLETFAKYTRTPIGFFFLPEPPIEKIPIADYRTVENEFIERPSADLLDTIYLCQQRQDWYRSYLRSNHEIEMAFVGAAKITDSVVQTAAAMRTAIGFSIEERRAMPTWTEALRRFIDIADMHGIMVMCSGVVLNNNQRKLNPAEFRGFALADKFAPLIFINGADTKAAQMFTLAHELAHIWVGETGLSDPQAVRLPKNDIERWCNQVAAEFLAPLEMVKHEYDKKDELTRQVKRLSHIFKVSTLVILRRIFDASGLSRDEFQVAYNKELKILSEVKKGSGGDFYLTQGARLGKRFAKALIVSTLEGHTLYRDAFKMLGFSKQETFQELGQKL